MDTAERIGWQATPSTSVQGRRDKVFHPALGEMMARRATTVIEWDTDHSPVLPRPDLVVQLLADLDPGEQA